MEKLILNEEWEKDEVSRQEGLKYMKEHPLSLEQKLEQVRRNEEIRKKNMLSMQKKEKNLSENSSATSPVTIEVLRQLFNIGCKNLELPQSSCLALTLMLQSKEELGTMVKWMLKQEKLGNKPTLSEVVLIAEKIKDYYHSS